jgi:hypothetical protein
MKVLSPQLAKEIRQAKKNVLEGVPHDFSQKSLTSREKEKSTYIFKYQVVNMEEPEWI